MFGAWLVAISSGGHSSYLSVHFCRSLILCQSSPPYSPRALLAHYYESMVQKGRREVHWVQSFGREAYGCDEKKVDLA